MAFRIWPSRIRLANTVTVLLGNGSGAFAEVFGSPFRVGSLPVSIAVGDFNGDGIQDLVTANGNANTVTVLIGNGLGLFRDAVGSPIAVGTEPFFVATGDFNQDGKQDLAIANNGDDTVSILMGNGAGGFNPQESDSGQSPYAVGSGPIAIVVGDFNRDGNPDLAIAKAGDNTVTVLLGRGSGGMGAFQSGPGRSVRGGIGPLSP